MAQYIESACRLASSSFVSLQEKGCILSASEKILKELWKFEYKSYSGNVQILTKAFWDFVKTKLECEEAVYNCQAYFGEDVNPPNEHGNVVLYVQPLKTAERYVFKLNL